MHCVSTTVPAVQHFWSGWLRCPPSSVSLVLIFGVVRRRVATCCVKTPTVSSGCRDARPCVSTTAPAIQHFWSGRLRCPPFSVSLFLIFGVVLRRVATCCVKTPTMSSGCRDARPCVSTTVPAIQHFWSGRLRCPPCSVSLVLIFGVVRRRVATCCVKTPTMSSGCRDARPCVSTTAPAIQHFWSGWLRCPPSSVSSVLIFGVVRHRVATCCAKTPTVVVRRRDAIYCVSTTVPPPRNKSDTLF